MNFFDQKVLREMKLNHDIRNLFAPNVVSFGLNLQIMLPENFQEFIDALTSQVKNNIIPMSRIDDAVKRILRVKFVMGLFEDPIADLSLASHLGSQV